MRTADFCGRIFGRGKYAWIAKAKGLMQCEADWARYMPMWEEYLNDPQTTPEAELMTYIYLPVPQPGKEIPDALAGVGGMRVHGYCVASVSFSIAACPRLPPIHVRNRPCRIDLEGSCKFNIQC